MKPVYEDNGEHDFYVVAVSSGYSRAIVELSARRLNQPVEPESGSTTAPGIGATLPDHFCILGKTLKKWFCGIKKVTFWNCENQILTFENNSNFFFEVAHPPPPPVL